MYAAINVTNGFAVSWYFVSFIVLMSVLFSNVLIGLVLAEYQNYRDEIKKNIQKKKDIIRRQRLNHYLISLEEILKTAEEEKRLYELAHPSMPVANSNVSLMSADTIVSTNSNSSINNNNEDEDDQKSASNTPHSQQHQQHHHQQQQQYSSPSVHSKARTPQHMVRHHQSETSPLSTSYTSRITTHEKVKKAIQNVNEAMSEMSDSSRYYESVQKLLERAETFVGRTETSP